MLASGHASPGYTVYLSASAAVIRLMEWIAALPILSLMFAFLGRLSEFVVAWTMTPRKVGR